MAKRPTKAEKEAAAAAAKQAASRDLLAEAVNATNTGQPLMATEAEMLPLLSAQGGPLVEFNKAMQQGDKIAFRATALGVQAFNTRGQPVVPAAPAWGAPAPVAPPMAPTFQAPPLVPVAPVAPVAAPGGNGKGFRFDTGIPVPAPRRGGRGSTVYGFETMDVGVSFFVPATGDNPNPAKRIASTVSSASTRLDPKKFVVRSVDETASGNGKGARVWRTA